MLTVRTVPDLDRITKEAVVRAAVVVVHTPHQVAVGDAGAGDEAVVPGDEIVRAQDL